MDEQLTKRQHYVWQKYLKAWSDFHLKGKAMVWTLFKNSNEIRFVSTKDVALSNCFYKIEQLSQKEFDFVKKLVDSSVPPLAKSLIDVFLIVYESLLNVNFELLDKERQTLYNQTTINLFERVMCQIEAMGLPLLTCHSSYDLSALSDDALDEVIFYIATQYSRTRNKKDAIVNSMLERPDLSSLSDKIYPVLMMVSAAIITYNIMTSNYQIVVLHNDSNIPFTTGDQPAINICSDLDKNGFVKEFHLYYPISPVLAIQIIPTNSTDKFKDEFVDCDCVKDLNSKIADNAQFCVFANKESVLQKKKR